MNSLKAQVQTQDEILLQAMSDACEFDLEVNEGPISLDEIQEPIVNQAVISMKDFRKAMGYSK